MVSLLSLPSQLVSDLPLFLLSVLLNAEFDVVLKLSAFLCSQLIELKLKDLRPVWINTVSQHIDDSSLLLSTELSNTVFQSIFLILTHPLLCSRLFQGLLHQVADLILLSLILVLKVPIVIVIAILLSLLIK